MSNIFISRNKVNEFLDQILKEKYDFTQNSNWDECQTFSREDVYDIMDSLIILSQQLVEDEVDRRKKHICEMGYSSCNYRGYCDGSC